MILFHGNQDKYMIPKYGNGYKNNDYGQGFYTTDDIELAKEWAYTQYIKNGNGHWVHTYDIDIDKLNVYNLLNDDILYWLAQLYKFRILDSLSEVEKDRLEKFQSIFYKDLTGYDIIIGWRADDSYFRYARDFLSGRIYKSTLEEAIKLGKLGIQYFIQSKDAIESLKIIKEPLKVDEAYRHKYIKRDKIAKNEYELKLDNNKYKTEKLTIDMILDRM